MVPEPSHLIPLVFETNFARLGSTALGPSSAALELGSAAHGPGGTALGLISHPPGPSEAQPSAAEPGGTGELPNF